MNEGKIKELKKQIEALEKEKPRTDREILESIERLLKELVSKKNEVTPLPLTVGWDTACKAPVTNSYQRYSAFAPDLRTLKEKVDDLLTR